MRDLVNNIGVVSALAPAVLTANTNGATLDLLGFGSAALSINTGAVAGDGDFTAKLQESYDGAAFSDVEGKDIEGALPASLAADSVAKIGYKGFKRYIRLVITKNSGTSIAASAVVIKGHPAQRPVI